MKAMHMLEDLKGLSHEVIMTAFALREQKNCFSLRSDGYAQRKDAQRGQSVFVPKTKLDSRQHIHYGI